jgi:hypothetical protein
MNSEELKRFLETQRNSTSSEDFFWLVFDMVENKPTMEMRDILESYLLTYSYVDEDRVARYLERFLHDADPHALTFVLPELGKLARKADSLAERILEEFTEEGSRWTEEIWRGLSLSEQTQNEERLDQKLAADEQNLPEKEFFELVIGMLEKDPSEAARDVLKKYLLIHSSVDQDRVARYLERFLSAPDPLERELAARDLAFLANEPDSLAYKILTDYLGEEPTADNKWKILNRRLGDLFPRHNNSEDQ